MRALKQRRRGMNDREIVNLYWQRSEQAISETERKYGSYCHIIAYNILENSEDSEECVNDTWMSAWNAMPDKRPDRLSPFLARITRNFALTKIGPPHGKEAGRRRSGACTGGTGPVPLLRLRSGKGNRRSGAEPRHRRIYRAAR